MMHKLVREIAKKHNLTHGRTLEMLVDFFETLVEQDKIVTQDLVDYFESEVLEAVKAGEFVTPVTPKSIKEVIEESLERLDADTKEIVKFLLESYVRVKTPVDIKFIGDKKAVVGVYTNGYRGPQVAVVTKVNGMLLHAVVNASDPFATG